MTLLQVEICVYSNYTAVLQFGLVLFEYDEVQYWQTFNMILSFLGPLPETVKDFWQMVWDHKLRTIVMLTKPVEAGTVKCEVYWPEKVNETLTLKPTLQVRTTYMQYFADFDMRNFELSNVSKDLCTNAVKVVV